MAANLQSRGLVSLGKRFVVSQIRSRDPAAAAAIISSPVRSVHASAYDKNLESLEENFHSTVVPDHVIPPQPEEYWAPHPKTGVFGPATGDGPTSGGDMHAGASASAESVLEQKTFFRPMEDLDKPDQP